MLFGVAGFLDFQKADAWDRLSLDLHINHVQTPPWHISHQEQKVVNYLQRNPEKVCDRKY